MDLAARLLHPAVQSLLLAVLCTALVVGRKPRPALVAGFFSVAWIWLASTPAFALHLRSGLIADVQAQSAAAAATTGASANAVAIVVLGGGKLPAGDWDGTTTRVGYGLRLWREGVATTMLLSGSDQARTMARGMVTAGVPPARLLTEDTSTNTHENARNSARMLRAEGLRDILLVTSQTHMRRAAAAFAHEGLRVIPAPAADRHAVLEHQVPWFPQRAALTLTARCLHEYTALWIYRERGWL